MTTTRILWPSVRPQQADRWVWGTVTQASPLRVRLDGDTAALLVTPTALTVGLTVGARVYCHLNGTALTVVAPARASASTATTTALAAAVNGMVKSANGRTMRVVAGVIRNTGSGWSLISDSSHQAVNVDSVSTSTSAITINHAAIGATKVVSFVVTPDETLANIGLVAGSSVGLTSTTIQLSQGRPFADYVSYNGSAWVSAGGVFSLSYSGASGVLTCTHPAIPAASDRLYDAQVTGRGELLASSAGVSNTTCLVRWHNYSGTVQTTASTNMRAFVSHGASGPLDPTLLTTTVYPNSNLWFVGLFETAI